MSFSILFFSPFSRFLSSNSGKIYLQKDIRMIIFRKSDLDTASDYTSSKGFELRSFTQGPNNPKFSPRRWFKIKRFENNEKKWTIWLSWRDGSNPTTYQQLNLKNSGLNFECQIQIFWDFFAHYIKIDWIPVPNLHSSVEYFAHFWSFANIWFPHSLIK